MSFPVPLQIPILTIGQETEVSLGAIHDIDEKFTNRTFTIAIENNGKYVALEGSHRDLEELTANLGLVVAELRESWLMGEVRKGREASFTQGIGR